MSEISQEQATDDHHHHHHHHDDDDDDDDESNSRKAKIPRTTKELEVLLPLPGVILPDDILLYILLSLSPIAVLRLLYTSKNGYSRIYDPSFLRNHARVFHTQRYLDNRPRPVLPPGLLFSTNCTIRDSTIHPLYVILSQNQDQNQEEPSLKAFLDESLPAFKLKFPRSFIVDSCNGLLLYCDTDRVLAPGVHDQYKVVNPLFSQCKEVPLMELLQKFKEPDQIKVQEHPRILFDPSLLLYYKVIVLLREPSHPDTEFQLHVYSSQTNSWTLVGIFPHEEENYVRWETVMSGGVFYWLRDHDSICFDFVEETVWFEPLPVMSEEFTDRDIFYLGECRGRLRLIEEHNTDRGLAHWFPFYFKMMEMEKELDSTTSWTENSRVIIDAGYDHLVQRKNDGYQDGIQVMHLYETEQGEEAVLLNIDYQRLISFNITTHTFGEEITLLPYFERYYGIDAFPFTPTLFPLRT